MAGDSTESWLEQLAAKTPTPGGGAAAGLGAAMAAALLAMVANYTSGDRYADRAARMAEMVEELAALRLAALEAMDDDEVAFGAVGAAYALPRANDAEKAARGAAIEVALLGATKPPLAVGRACERLATFAQELADQGNPNVISDVGVGAAFARAAVDSALLNVAINASLISDEAQRGELAVAMQRLHELSRDLQAAFELVAAKLGN
jgi:formiminotetrahydrofolate cyclodeaminase